MPPSLRLGLIDVLDQIGGDQAQGILAEQLDTTGRAIEVAYIARVLQDEAPDKYRDNALKAAKELLASPPCSLQAVKPMAARHRLTAAARFIFRRSFGATGGAGGP